MIPFKGVYRWFIKQRVAIQATLIGGVFVIAASIIGIIVPYYLNRSLSTHISYLHSEVSPFHCPPIEQLTKDQIRRLQDCDYLTEIQIANEGGFPIIQLVVRIPTEGIAEAVLDRNNSMVSDFEGRLMVPAIEPLK